MNDIKFYKGESIALVFTAYDKDGNPLNLSGYEKEVSLFTPFSSKLVKSVTYVSNSSFSANVTGEETSGFEQEGHLNLVIKLKKGGEVKIGKSIPCVLLDPDSSGCGDVGRLSVDSGSLKIDMNFDTDVANFDLFFGNGINLIDGETVEQYLYDYAKTTDTSGTVIRSGELSQEKGSDTKKTISQKAFTDDSISKDKTTLNVSQLNNKFDYLTNQEARNAVPSNLRALGQIISYKLASGKWVTEKFIGAATTGWTTESNWSNTGLVVETLNTKLYGGNTGGDIEVIPYSLGIQNTVYNAAEIVSLFYKLPTALIGKHVSAIKINVVTTGTLDIVFASGVGIGTTTYTELRVFSIPVASTGVQTIAIPVPYLMTAGTTIGFRPKNNFTFKHQHEPRSANPVGGGFDIRTYISANGSTVWTERVDGDICVGVLINDSAIKGDIPEILDTLEGKADFKNNILQFGSEGSIDISVDVRSKIIAGGVNDAAGILYPTWVNWNCVWMYPLKPDTDYTVDLTGYTSGSTNAIHLYKLSTDTTSTTKIPWNSTNIYAFNSGDTPYMSFVVRRGDAPLFDIRTTVKAFKGFEPTTIYTLDGQEVLNLDDVNSGGNLAIDLKHVKRYKQPELYFKVNDILKNVSTDTGNTVFNIYVSSSRGVDTNNGTTYYTPVATIEKALSLIPTTSLSLVRIRLQIGDVFRVASTVNINYPDKDIRFDGTNESVFSSFNDLSRPIIKGSKLLTSSNFTLVSTGIYRTPITKPFYHFIAVNNEMRLPASTIREGKWYEATKVLPKISAISTETIEGVKYHNITLPSADITKLAAEFTDAYITVFHEWCSYKSKILSVNTSNNTIRVAQSNKGGVSVSMVVNDRYIIENINTSLSVDANRITFSEGSYYTKSGYLYYKLKEGETISSIAVELPEVSELINVSSKCAFSGINFSQTYHNFFEEDSRFSLDVSQGRTFPCSIISTSISLVFANCDFSLFGRNCINFKNGAKDSYIYNCTFHDLGAGVIRIGEYDQSNQTATDLPFNIHVHNSVAKNTSKVLQQAAGVMLTFADTCSVTNCDLSRIGYSAITLGYAWSPSHSNPTSIKKLRIAYNHLHHTCNFLLNDLGGIHVQGNLSGSSIENNIIHDIHSQNRLSVAVYLDEGSADITVRNNLIYGSPYLYFSHQGDKSNTGANNTICNNIFAYPLIAPIYAEQAIGEFINRNIMYYDIPITNPLTKFIRTAFNLLYDKRNISPTFTYGSSTLIENPQFINPKILDFRFKTFDIIDKIGFEVFDTSIVGVAGNYFKEFAKIPDNEMALFNSRVRTEYNTTCELYN